ncbi:HAD family hydrolase [Aliarcobacter butzleri]|uniref:HAD family hydrolase n=1 Tax=Aliarcobacter butzleri TaxID=28197 RepID=UPI003B228D2A
MIKNILWDFDGVIVDSMPIRDYGFRKIFDKYAKEIVEEFIKYHRINGGLSRFHKIKYFYNTLLNKEISEEQIQNYAEQFTIIMKEQLINKKYLIEDSLNFIKLNHKNYNFHIVSGSEHNELNYICKKLDLVDYFLSINGSPTPKNDLIKNLLEKEQYRIEETILVGDSFNDYEAANINGIYFYGYNNNELNEFTTYIKSFSDIGTL